MTHSTICLHAHNWLVSYVTKSADGTYKEFDGIGKNALPAVLVKATNVSIAIAKAEQVIEKDLPKGTWYAITDIGICADEDEEIELFIDYEEEYEESEKEAEEEEEAEKEESSEDSDEEPSEDNGLYQWEVRWALWRADGTYMDCNGDSDCPPPIYPYAIDSYDAIDLAYKTITHEYLQEGDSAFITETVLLNNPENDIDRDRVAYVEKNN